MLDGVNKEKIRLREEVISSRRIINNLSKQQQRASGDRSSSSPPPPWHMPILQQQTHPRPSSPGDTSTSSVTYERIGKTDPRRTPAGAGGPLASTSVNVSRYNDPGDGSEPKRSSKSVHREHGRFENQHYRASNILAQQGKSPSSSTSNRDRVASPSLSTQFHLRRQIQMQQGGGGYSSGEESSKKPAFSVVRK